MVGAIFALVAFIVLCPLPKASAEDAEDWQNKVSISSDFRLRGEYIEQETSPVRNRQRLRARAGLGYEVNEQIKGQLSLTTGEGNDPISMNQSMDGSASYKDITIYEANVAWKPMDGMNIILGKAAPIFKTVGKSELVWDHDLRTEGAAIEYKMGSDGVQYGANLASYVFEERSADEDTQLLGGQIFGKFDVADNIGLEPYVGLYHYSHMAGRVALDYTGAGTDFNGNSNSGGRYSGNYGLLNGGLALNFKAFGESSSIFYEHVNNTLIDNDNKGWLAGLRVGSVKEAGDLSFRYNYRNLEADAVVGAFNDSDFTGGGTNAQGSEYGLDYGLAKNAQVNFTFFDTELSANSGGLKYRRAQLDFVFSM